MNLYRIDLTGPQGQFLGSVCDMLGPRLIRSRQQANGAAILAAANGARFAHVIRIQGAGHVRRVGIVSPGSDTVGRCNDNIVPGLQLAGNKA